MELSEFILANAPLLAAECGQFAGTLLPAADSLDVEALRNHTEQMLRKIAADMQRSGPAAQRGQDAERTNAEGEALSAAQVHGDQRAEEGFTVSQTVAEFRALRAIVLRRWLETRPSIEAAGFEELIRFNEGIDQALAEAIHRYSAAITLDRSQFLGVLSHEMRTPIATILSSAHALRLAADRQSTLPPAIERTQRAARSLVSVLDDLLDYVRCGVRGGMRLTPMAFSMDELCKEVASDMSDGYPDRAIEFESDGDLRGTWDEQRITQAVQNLVTNALKCGAPRTPVLVAVRESDEGAQVVVEVHNSGPPIPPRTLESLFKPLVRGSEDDESGISLGLGLYIVREIAGAHGGRVEAESTDAGTVFRLVVPKAADGIRTSGFGNLGKN